MAVPVPSGAFPTHVLPVRIGNTWFGVDALHVEEIVELGRCVKVPRTSPEIVGVLQWRGRLRAVVDVATLMGSTVDSPVEACARAVFVRAGHDASALPVHDVREVREARGEDFRSPRPDLPWFVAAEMELDGDVVEILDLEALLDGGPLAPEPGRPSEGPAATVAFVVFAGDGVSYAIPAASVRAIASAADWHGTEPVEPFGHAATVAADARPTAARILVVPAPGGDVPVRVTGEISFAQVDPSLVLALPALVRRSDERELVSGVAFVEGRPPILVLNPRAIAS